jgi:mono/diheme cytochrome c family protein/ketosteroid isomerase-like protein
MPFISRKSLGLLLLLVVIAFIVVLGFVWSGFYDVGADDPHTRPMLALMETLRDRSIHVRSKDVTVPNLEDPQLVLKGAGQYAAMCTGCHLAPGMEESEIRPGLYPQPPDLSKVRIDPRDAFWVIKHGVKMTAMPAWGSSHDDPTIWSMVAFLQKLPDMTSARYKDMVARAPADEEMEGGHHHHHAADGDHDETSAAAHDTAAIEGYSAKAVPEAEAVAEAFHAALQKGDRARVLQLLASDVKISEGGETQDRATYAADHLGDDIAFLQKATVHPQFLGSMPMGDTAMVASRSEVHASHDGRPLTLLSTEVLTLKNTAAGWRITRVEWTSERK